MTLSDVSIKNPVFAWMLMAALILFGALSFNRLGISQLPDVDFPVVSVKVDWPGAAPENLELAVADVIEGAVMSVEGVRNITSSSRKGSVDVSVEFELDKDINVALQDVQAKVAQVQKMLPKDVDTPTISKSNPEDQPILWLAVAGDKPLREIILFIRDHLKDQITRINGVGDVRLGGYVEPSMRVWLDPQKLRQQELTVDDIIKAIDSQHLLSPSGYIDDGAKETNIRVISEAHNANEFENLLIPTRNGQPIWKPMPLKTVARCEEGLSDVRRISRVNGVRSVGIGVVKQRGSNAVEVGRLVKREVEEIQKRLPPGFQIQVVSDATRFIEESTHELIFTLILSSILTAIVCWLFLGTFSSAFNVVLAIPTSLIGSFIFIYFSGFTLNTFTLLGLSLSIGIVVDDAIMVLENIVRHKEMGKTKLNAALDGAREITSAAVAATLAILAIFIPVIFMKGPIGKFFFQFGVTMSVAVMISLLEALTLAPMRCSQFLASGHDTWIGRMTDRWMTKFENHYSRVLTFILNHRLKIVSVSLIIFAFSLSVVKSLKKEFVPPQDQSRFMMNVQTPLGSSIGFTDEVFKKIESYLSTRPEIKTYYSAVGGFGGGMVNQGVFFITLHQPKERPAKEPFAKPPTQSEVMDLMRSEIKNISGVKKAAVIDLSLSSLGGGGGGGRNYPIQFSVQGPSWDKLGELSKTIIDQLNSSGLVTDADTDYQLGMPEVRIIPDRDKASMHGVTIQKITNAIGATVSSLRVGKYSDESGHRDDVLLKLLDEYNKTPEDISKIQVFNMHGQLVRLSDLVKLEEHPTLLTITRMNRARAISIFANIKKGASQADVMAFIDSKIKAQLPQGYTLVSGGNSKGMQEAFSGLMMALILGVLVAYMFLGSQFNSFVHPVTVLLALPFSITGAFLALKITDISLNMYSMIGILLLMGIVKKNSILLVDFTNEKRKEGMSVKDALLVACPLRLRAIIMTSVATIAGVIPAAFAFGPGAETTRPMAVVVIGGVTLSTLLTLLVIPCAYSLFSKIELSK